MKVGIFPSLEKDGKKTRIMVDEQSGQEHEIRLVSFVQRCQGIAF